jgi:folate-binding protein YgfZ
MFLKSPQLGQCVPVRARQPKPMTSPAHSAKTFAQTLILEGSDALSFASAQFSSDVHAVAVGTWQWSAWLDARGRVRVFFQLARLDEHRLLLLLRGGDAETIAEALRRFVFRSRLSIQAQPPRSLIDGPALEAGHVHTDGNHIALGAGEYSLRIVDTSSDTSSDAAQQWRLAEICNGHPWLPDAALDSLLPPALSMERLGAVSFSKGCFPGQEITARLHFRGGHKHHLHRVVLSQSAAPGSAIATPSGVCGIVLDSVADGEHFSALAVIADEPAQQALRIPLCIVDTDIGVSIASGWSE